MNARNDQHIDDLAQGYGSHFTPDVEKGLARLHQRIGVQGQQRRPAKMRSLLTGRGWMSVAASVAMLIVAGFFFLSSDGTIIVNDTTEPMAITLPDDTKVILQQGSQISYNGEYAGAERRVELEGQGYFEVAHDADRPFLVSVDATTLRVTGTAFNLRAHNGELEVEVSEGSVVLQHGTTETPIRAKQCGVAKVGTKPMMMDAPNLNRHAWRTGQLRFENRSVQDVLDVLHNNWGTKVELAEDCQFPVSATWNTTDPAVVMDALVKLGGGRLIEQGPNAYALEGPCTQ